MTDAFFVPDGDRFVPTELTRGPWSPDAQHGGPPAALLGRALERCDSRDGWWLARISVELLGPVPLEPVTVSARVLRPGRSVELLEATLEAGGRATARALAWRLRTSELGTSIGLDDAPSPPPEAGHEGTFFPGAADVGYHTANEVRFLEGDFIEPGPARAWLRMRHPLVAGEAPSGWQRVLMAADTGNGISAELDIRSYVYINPDLFVQLLRPLEGEWVLLDSSTSIERSGVGLSESTIHDRCGRLGRTGQTLFASRRPGAEA